MRIIEKKLVYDKFKNLVSRVNSELRQDVEVSLKNGQKTERNKLGKHALGEIYENAQIAKKEKQPICQAIGLPIIFLEIGHKVYINGNLNYIINEIIMNAYKKDILNASFHKNTFNSNNRETNPVIIHTDITEGAELKISLFLGSDYKTHAKLLDPETSSSEIKNYIVNVVSETGPKICPPYIIGIGIGGTLDYAGLLAKKSLLRPFSSNNKNKEISIFEQDLLNSINTLNIGPLRLGGNVTTLTVKADACASHISGIPVAVQICCHAFRCLNVVI